MVELLRSLSGVADGRDTHYLLITNMERQQWWGLGPSHISRHKLQGGLASVISLTVILVVVIAVSRVLETPIIRKQSSFLCLLIMCCTGVANVTKYKNYYVRCEEDLGER